MSNPTEQRPRVRAFVETFDRGDLDQVMATRDKLNAYRYTEGKHGHYESYFQRANHPARPLAFWIRYTTFVPQGSPADAQGELWAIYFDGETGRTAAVRETVPLSECRFSGTSLDVSIGGAVLDARRLEGGARTKEHQIRWSLVYDSPEPPLLLLTPRMYEARLPKAKALVGSPRAVFGGHLEVDGSRVDVDRWVGSQNHNWGSKHTDRYAWGQVAGFDNAPDAFFECATASVKLGPVYTPRMSPMVLRYAGEEYRFNSLLQSLRATGSYGYFTWQLESQSAQAGIKARIHAEPSTFVALRYRNPPGGIKTCLNSKLAACELTLYRKGQPAVRLETAHRAAFEILTDDEGHGIPVLDA